MSDSGKKIRINRIFQGPNRKALVVAFDHAIVLGPIPGTIDPSSQIRRFADSGADAILLNFGVLQRSIDSLLVPNPPALILRVDWTSLWTAGDRKLVSQLLATPEQALQQGADAVLTYLFVGTGDPEFESREIARNAEVARECERLGIPLIIESLARGKDVENPLAPEWMKLHTRISSELGADLIKTEYTGDPHSMRGIVEICPAPILVLGGARYASDADALNVVRGAVQAGASGIFFGRNIFQAPKMSEFCQKARSILDGAVKEGKVRAVVSN